MISDRQFYEIYSVFYNIDIDDLEYQDYMNQITSPSQNISKTCGYVFTKGTRKNQKCERKISDDKCYCTKHSECENKGQPNKKGFTKPSNTKTRGTIVKKMFDQDDQKKRTYIVKHRSCGFFWHPESRFVFNPDTKKVIGIYSEYEVHKLNEQDIKICNTYGFKIST